MSTYLYLQVVKELTKRQTERDVFIRWRRHAMAPEINVQLRSHPERPLCLDVVYAGDRVLPVHYPLSGRSCRLSAVVGPADRRHIDADRRISV